MNTKINKIKIALCIALVFIGLMGFGQGVAINPAMKTLEAWIYPGPPTCNAYYEFTDGRKIDVLRPEYLAVYYDKTNANNPDNGHLFEVNPSYTGTGTSATGSSCNYDCNSYSSGNATSIKNNSNSQLITISGRKLGLDKLLQQISATNSNLNSNTWINDYVKTPILDMLNTTGYTGIDIDFESPNGGWNTLTNNNLKKYGYLINYLYSQLHSMNPVRQLNITLPKGINNDVISYLANYVNFDFITLMCYDQNYIDGTTINNSPVAEDTWVEEGIDDILTYIPVNKVIIGMPSYGYHIDPAHGAIPCTINTVEQEATSDYSIKNDTKQETANSTGGSTYLDSYSGGNLRDPNSHERYFVRNGFKWYYQDVIGMCEKQEFIRSKGIKHIAVWHLGGNDWFNRFDINISDNTILDNDYKLASTCLPVTSIVNNTSYPYPGQYYYSTTNKTIDNENNMNHYATISSSVGNNTLEFSGYSFTAPLAGENYIAGFEVIVIGRAQNNNSNLGDPLYKSDLTIQLSCNGQDTPPIPFSIYSPHDICKLFGSTTDMMGLGILNSPVNSSFKVKINHISGSNAYVTAVFVKPYYSNTPPPPPPCTYFATPENINTVVSAWSNSATYPKLIYNDVYVKNGGVLTITGTVKFTEQAKIVVEEGGQLIINGGTLTNLCENKFWQGITVKGHNSISQFDLSGHGKITLINGATISNAVCAIQTLKYNDNPSYGSGIICAWNANFINNQTAINMREFTNRTLSGSPFIDISTFKNCNFITDNNYINPTATPFQQFINLNKIKGIEIFGCHFKNNSSNITTNFSNAGIGIKSTESYFKIDNFAGQSEFYGLQYGIYSSSLTTFYGITVKNTIFDKNLHGAYALGMNNVWFTSNEFRVIDLENPGDDAQSNAYGLYLENCKKGYTIEGNFFRNIIGSSFNGTNGMIVNNSQGDAKRVYNNTFNNIKYGMLAYQNNGGDLLYNNGLTIKCNDFITNYRDIAITPNNCAGICPTQGANINGDATSPAGNTFTHLGPSGTPTDFNNRASNNPVYYHHPGTTSNEWIPVYYNKIQPSPNNSIGSFNKSTACPPKAVPNSGSLDPLYINTSRVASRQLLNSAKLMYTIWVDGGNTPALKDAVDLSYPWEAFALYNNLISLSPYLSDEVIIAAIENEEGLPPLMLKLVLLANPQAARSQKVMDALYARINPLPEEWIDEIKQGMEIISPRTELEANIGYYTGEYQQYSDILKAYYIADTSEYATDSLIALLSNTDMITDVYELAFLYLNNNRDSEADQLMENIPNTNLLQTEYETDCYNQTMYYFNICKKLKNNGYENLGPEELEWIFTTSENGNAVYNGNAIAIRLKYEEDYQYHEPIFYPEEVEMRMAKRKPVLAIKESLSASPNPANEFTIISYKITDIHLNNAVIEVYDVMGRLLSSKNLNFLSGEQIFNCTSYVSGQYLCKLINNGKLINTVKFNVIH